MTKKNHYSSKSNIGKTSVNGKPSSIGSSKPTHMSGTITSYASFNKTEPNSAIITAKRFSPIHNSFDHSDI